MNRSGRAEALLQRVHQTRPITDEMTVDHQVCAQRIGRIAESLIAQGCEGRVLAAVSGAIYLATSEGELFWLIRDSLPMHQRALRACFDWSSIREGMPFSAQARRLHLDDAVTIDCTAASPWVPSHIHLDRLPRPEVIRDRVTGLGEQVLSTKMPKRASSVVSDIECACARQDIADVARFSRELIGLGPGLTPSGDDFVGGLLFTLHYLHLAYPHLGTWDEQPVGLLLGYGSTQTHLISYTLLRDHADGQGAEPLHRLLTNILDLESTGEIVESAQQVIRIGNTSGAELLAGALTAMKFLDHRGDWNANRYQTAN